jgi:hypothetical protein
VPIFVSRPLRLRNTATLRWRSQLAFEDETRPRNTSRAAPAGSKWIVTLVGDEAAWASVAVPNSEAHTSTAMAIDLRMVILSTRTPPHRGARALHAFLRL